MNWWTRFVSVIASWLLLWCLIAYRNFLRMTLFISSMTRHMWLWWQFFFCSIRTEMLHSVHNQCHAIRFFFFCFFFLASCLSVSVHCLLNLYEKYAERWRDSYTYLLHLNLDTEHILRLAKKNWIPCVPCSPYKTQIYIVSSHRHWSFNAQYRSLLRATKLKQPYTQTHRHSHTYPHTNTA